jgi:mannonate dehydratase
MKLGFGLYRHMLDDRHFAFARQCGATHVVAHLCDYHRGRDGAGRDDQPVGDLAGWGVAEGRIWDVDELVALREAMARHGLTLFAIENFDPGIWYDVLFDGPRRAEQIGLVQRQIRHVGAAGIAVFGYNFSLAGVAGRITAPAARGGAVSVGLDGRNEVTEAPLPASMAWNMVVDPQATGLRPPVTQAELWRRFAAFLDAVIPVAEAAGVTMAAHPDDPPLETVRGQPRLVYQPRLCQRVVDLSPSPANALEFCVGTIAEMREGDVYETVRRHAAQGRIAYMHLRNVRGRVPHYHETFIDEGDVDIARVIGILHAAGYDGVVIPDHAPRMACDAPWHAGMAFAMGYLRALLQAVQRDAPGAP